MRRKLTRQNGIGGLALLVLAAAIGAAYADAGSGGVSHSTKAQGTKTLRFDEKGTYFKLVDNPPANTTQNPEVGDTILFRSDLISGTRKVGTDQGFCTLIAPPRAQCAVTLYLRSGTLVFMDALSFGTGQRYAFAMSGGTGAYQSVHGQAWVTQLAPTHFRWVVRVER